MTATKRLTVRLESRVMELVITVSKNRGESRSNLVRRAILKELANLSFLSEPEKKALGVRLINGKRK